MENENDLNDPKVVVLQDERIKKDFVASFIKGADLNRQRNKDKLNNFLRRITIKMGKGHFRTDANSLT